MRINHFLPFFFCSVILLFLCPPSKSPLHHIVLSFCSSSACSIVLLCFISIVLLCFCSLFLFCSLFHHILDLIYYLPPRMSFLLFYSFSLQNSQPNSVSFNSFIQATLTIPLPLPFGNTGTSVLALETLTDLSSSVRFS
jgi:predicted PurR-regulated permease PerM